jgi:hypothetical protein
MLYMAIFLLMDNGISDKNSVQTASQKHAAMGAIVMIYFSGFGWALGWNVSLPRIHLGEALLTKTSRSSTSSTVKSTRSDFVHLEAVSP